MGGETRLPWHGLRNAAILLALWEIVGRLDLVAGGALPGITEILLRLWEDRADYPRHRATRAVTLNSAIPEAPAQTGGRAAQVVLAAGAVTLPFLLWWAFIRLTGVPDLIAKTPLVVIDYLFFARTAETAQARLLAALAETLPITFAGMLAGLGFAFALAIASKVFPRAIEAFMPVALITETMPLVALTPLLVLILGRGPSLTLWVTISVTFFPAFVTLAQGIALVPRSAEELPRAYGGSRWTEIRMVTIPASLPYLFAATRLTVPRSARCHDRGVAGDR